MLLDPVEYVDPPNAPAPVPAEAPAACREGVKKFPLTPAIQMVLVGATLSHGLVAIQSNTDTTWMEKGTNHSSQWAQLRGVWLKITLDPWSLTLHWQLDCFKGINLMA